MANDAPAPGTCKTYPAIPAVPSRPSYYTSEVDEGWNAGANSVKQLSGDVFLAFTQPQVRGAAMGFVASRDTPDDYARITHGFMFTSDAIGRPTWAIMESGRLLTNPAVYAPTSVFRIERANGVVSYLLDGSLIMISQTESIGQVMAGCSLYSSGDAVESQEQP